MRSTSPPTVLSQPTTTHTTACRPALPAQFLDTRTPPTLHYQGAEALVYRTHFLTPAHALPAALKHRPSKPYRHPVLDARLTRHRILAEARVLAKLRQQQHQANGAGGGGGGGAGGGAGVAVPALYALDWEAGWLLEEWVDGWTVRRVLDVLLEGYVKSTAVGEGEEGAAGGAPMPGAEGLRGLMARIGRAVGKVHECGIVHGDLTTSNLMVRRPRRRRRRSSDIGIDFSVAAEPAELEEAGDVEAVDVNVDVDVEGDVVLIDFGLAATSQQEEDLSLIHI